MLEVMAQNDEDRSRGLTGYRHYVVSRERDGLRRSSCICGWHSPWVIGVGRRGPALRAHDRLHLQTTVSRTDWTIISKETISHGI